jgi:hypothetical protein
MDVYYTKISIAKTKNLLIWCESEKCKMNVNINIVKQYGRIFPVSASRNLIMTGVLIAGRGFKMNIYEKYEWQTERRRSREQEEREREDTEDDDEDRCDNLDCEDCPDQDECFI